MYIPDQQQQRSARCGGGDAELTTGNLGGWGTRPSLALTYTAPTKLRKKGGMPWVAFAFVASSTVTPKQDCTKPSTGVQMMEASRTRWRRGTVSGGNLGGRRRDIGRRLAGSQGVPDGWDLKYLDQPSCPESARAKKGLTGEGRRFGEIERQDRRVFLDSDEAQMQFCVMRSVGVHIKRLDGDEPRSTHPVNVLSCSRSLPRTTAPHDGRASLPQVEEGDLSSGETMEGYSSFAGLLYGGQSEVRNEDNG